MRGSTSPRRHDQSGRAPQVTPVWIDHDGDRIVFNTAKGRIKDRNLRHDPSVANSIPDSENPYKALVIQGRVEITEEGAEEHINALAKRYLDQNEYPSSQPGEVRLRVLIKPEKAAFGLG